MESRRAKVGFITPTGFTITVPEFVQIAPKGVDMNQTMLYLSDKNSRLSEQERIDAMIKDLDRAVTILDVAGVDIIAQVGMPFIFTKGLGFEQEVSIRLRRLTKIPILLMATAVNNALRSLGSRKLNIISYYSDSFNSMYKRYLERNEFEVMTIRNLPGTSNIKPPSSKYGDIPEGTIHRFAKSVHFENKGADALLISGGNFRTLNILQPLEDDLHLPVISSNIALFWSIFKELGINSKISGYGTLLSR